jgi:hypothetical protein
LAFADLVAPTLFQGDLASEPDGQLFFRINNGNDVQLGFINSDGTDRTTVYTGGGNDSQSAGSVVTGTGNETAVAVDPAAGLVFSVGVGNAGPQEAMTPSASTTSTPAR